jgi:alkyl hydroperoxide reductase subunit AhpF
MLTFFGDNDRRAVGQILTELQRPVHLLLFMALAGDEYGRTVYDFLHGLVGMHTRLHLEVHDTLADLTLALRLELRGLPAILVSRAAGAGGNIRFYGLPSGYTFSSLLEAVLLVGGATPPALRAETTAFLAQLRQPTHLLIFVTADDPRCPATVVLAHAFAHASPALVVDTLEIRAFPDLAARYGVSETPTLVIDEQTVIAGEVGEAAMLWHLRRAALECDLPRYR